MHCRIYAAPSKGLSLNAQFSIGLCKAAASKTEVDSISNTQLVLSTVFTNFERHSAPEMYIG